MIKRGIVLLLSLVVAATVSAQAESVRARYSASNPTPLIGEPVQLLLTVEVPADSTVTLPDFAVGDWDSFDVRSVEEPARTDSGDIAVYRQSLTVILWRTGNFGPPETIVEYQLPSGESFRIRVEPTLFTVLSTLQTGDVDLRPLKPPASLPYLSPLTVLVGIIFAVGVVRGVRWWRARQSNMLSHRILDRAGNPVYSPKQAALVELEHIRTQELPAMMVYAGVADCLRTYVERQFQVNALDMTTRELMDILQVQAEMVEPHQRDLQRMLDYADLVKFAHVQPGQRSTQQLLDTAERWIESVDPIEEVAQTPV
jgi:hypothetical protein